MNENDPGLLPLTGQVRGEYLAEIKSLARESYLRHEIGTEEAFARLWQQAFNAESGPTEKS
jgi:hypothetical protein